MRTKLILFVIACLTAGGLTSCSNEDSENKEMVITVASEKRIYSGLEEWGHSPYYAKESGNNQWIPWDHIEGFTHEEGYEYVLKIWQEKWHNGEIMDASIYRYKLLKVLSKVKKDSEGLPQ